MSSCTPLGWDTRRITTPGRTRAVNRLKTLREITFGYDPAMQVVGSGFLAGHISALSDVHEHVTVIAAGVSWTQATSIADFDREAGLVNDVLRRCRAEGRTALFFSTAASGMYGAPDSPGTETGPVFPLNAYTRHKLAIESVIRLSGADHLILRLSHVVGPGQPSHQLFPSLVRQIQSGAVRIHRAAHRDLLDVRHLVQVIDHLLTARVRNEVVNVASGVQQPVERIVDEIAKQLGTHPRREVVEGTSGTGDIDISRLRSLVPQIGRIGFGHDYLERLVARYVAAEQAAVR